MPDRELKVFYILFLLVSMDIRPSVLRDYKWTEDGFVETESGLLVPAFVGSQFGFSPYLRKRVLETDIYPRLRSECGVLPLCPFTAALEHLDLSRLSHSMTVQDNLAFWEDFNRLIGEVDYGCLMPRAKFMLALLDGSHAVDDGLAADVTNFATHYGYVVGIRSDFRLAENPASPINPAIRYFIDLGPFGGKLFCGPAAYDDALKAMKEMADGFRSGRTEA